MPSLRLNSPKGNKAIVPSHTQEGVGVVGVPLGRSQLLGTILEGSASLSTRLAAVPQSLSPLTHTHTHTAAHTSLTDQMPCAKDDPPARWNCFTACSLVRNDKASQAVARLFGFLRRTGPQRACYVG